ncbi:MAG: 50S ribosomal protein L13 [Vampirovibrionales bacterium]|nr:50S ribosomal protein L13 [Vampirovibrionales bacterium]
MYKSYVAKPLEIEREWVIVDAADQVLGRVAARVADILRGKHKPGYTPNVDCGDFVIVINADKIRVTGRKAEQKLYRHHTGYPGHLKTTVYKDLHAKHPDRVIEKAVWGMIKHNRLNHRLIRHLHVFAGSEHPHTAQMPKLLSFDQFPLAKATA